MKIRLKKILKGCDEFDLQWFSCSCWAVGHSVSSLWRWRDERRRRFHVCRWARHRPAGCRATITVRVGAEGKLIPLSLWARHREDPSVTVWSWKLLQSLERGISVSPGAAITAAAAPAACNVAWLYSQAGRAPSPGRPGWWTQTISAPSCRSWNAPPASTETQQKPKRETQTKRFLRKC